MLTLPTITAATRGRESLKRLRQKGLQRGLLSLVLLISAISPILPFAGNVEQAFAVAGPAPINLKAYVGGNSIGLTWNPGAGDSPTQYKIYRGGTLKATVAADTTSNYSGTTQRWLDTTVVNGTAYSYQVSAVNAASEESVKSSTVNVTQPSSPAAIPTITIDASVPADLVAFANQGQALIQAWYPKIYTAINTGTVSSSFSIKAASGTGYSAYWDSGQNAIVFDIDGARSHTADPRYVNVFVHESTHAQQHHTSGFMWTTEGMADYAEAYIFGDDTAKTINFSDTQAYQEGYGSASYLINWASSTYSKPNLMKDLNTALVNGQDVNGFFKTQTGGLSVGDLWYKMSGKKVSSRLELRNNASSTCVNADGVWNPNFYYTIQPCNGSGSQAFMFVPDSTTSNQGILKTESVLSNLCMDVYQSGTTDGTRVFSYTCNGTSAQEWIINADGSLKNTNSGKCLYPIGGSLATGTGLEIRTCSGASNQTWYIHPLGAMRSFTSGGKCVDVWGSGTTNGTKIDIYTCNDGQTSQTWTFNQTTNGSTDGSLRALGKCMDVSGSGTADGTNVQLWDCNNSAAQKWIPQSDGTFKNTNSNKCLTADSFTNGLQLVIRTCSGTNNLQKWTNPNL